MQLSAALGSGLVSNQIRRGGRRASTPFWVECLPALSRHRTITGSLLHSVRRIHLIAVFVRFARVIQDPVMRNNL